MLPRWDARLPGPARQPRNELKCAKLCKSGKKEVNFWRRKFKWDLSLSLTRSIRNAFWFVYRSADHDQGPACSSVSHLRKWVSEWETNTNQSQSLRRPITLLQTHFFLPSHPIHPNYLSFVIVSLSQHFLSLTQNLVNIFSASTTTTTISAQLSFFGALDRLYIYMYVLCLTRPTYHWLDDELSNFVRTCKKKL